MSALNELLDKAKNACGLASDNALAERVGVTRAMISKWRSDEKPIADERIAQLCALAKADGPEWMARIHAERAQSPAERALWSKMLTRLAAAALVLVPFAAAATPEKPANSMGYKSDSSGYVYYVKRVMGWLARKLPLPRVTTRSLQHA